MKNQMPIAAILFLMTALTAGCQQESSSNDAAPVAESDASASQLTPETTNTGQPGQMPTSDAAEAAVPSEQLRQTAGRAAQPGATQRPPVLNRVPPFLFRDTSGHSFGNRELHGRMSLVLAASTQPPATLREAGDAAKPVPSASTTAFLQRLQNDKSYFSRLQILGLAADAATVSSPPSANDDSSQPSSAATALDQVLLVAGAAELQNFKESVLGPDINNQSSQDLVALVDPVGQVRGHYHYSAESDVDQLLQDLDAVWSEQIAFVPEVINTPWLQVRQQTQLDSADQILARHDFSFQNRQRESGIRFVHQIVDDAGRDYKGVHYDHGNGLTVADIDGDQLPDVYFTTQLGRNHLYRNLGNGQFQDITSSAGVGVGDRVCVAATFADIDNDGDADLYVTSVRKGNLLFQNDGHGKFNDITQEAGVGGQGHPSAALFFDYDRDGLLDLFVSQVGRYTTDEVGAGGYFVGFADAFSGHLKPDRAETSRLYRNVDGTSFEDVTESVGLVDSGWTGDAGVIDANRDGWPDLYLLNMQGNDEYYENQNGQSFVRKSRELFPKTPFGAMGISVADFDNDLDLDIFVTDMHSDMSKDIMPDYRSEISKSTFFEEEKFKMLVQLPESMLQTNGASLFGNAYFRNDGANQFAEISDQIGAENYWPWGLSKGDLNADGFDDVFITSSMNYPFRYAVNSLLLNEAGQRFVDAEFILGAEPRHKNFTAQPWITVDCETETDSRLAKICEGQSGIVNIWGALGSRASVMLDFDNDGDLDILTSEFNDVPMVLVSDLADKQDIHFLKIQLQGSTSNRQGLGAEVTLHTSASSYLKVNDGALGYLSHGIPDLYFGLADQDTVDRIEVRWPSGGVQVVAGPIAANQVIRIVEE